MKVFVSRLFQCVAVWMLFTVPAFAAGGYDNSNALKDLTEAKVYFDVSLDKADALLMRMDLVERTLTQLREAGLAVTAVVGFRAGASRYITAGKHYVLDEEIETKLKIGEWVKSFAASDIRVEQCSIAAAQQGIVPADFLPEITIVKNGFVSLIGYQAKGFAVIPMD